MSVRKLKPVTPAQRFTVINGFDSITDSKPEKSLLRFLKKTGGRVYRAVCALAVFPLSVFNGIGNHRPAKYGHWCAAKGDKAAPENCPEIIICRG